MLPSGTHGSGLFGTDIPVIDVLAGDLIHNAWMHYS